MPCEHVAQMWRACLFLSLEEELHVDGWLHAAGSERVVRGQERDDGTFVVACGATVETPLALHGPWRRRERNDVATEPRPQRRRPRRRGPLCRVDGLPIVVRVEHHRTRRARAAKLAEHRRRRSRRLEKTRLDAA